MKLPESDDNLSTQLNLLFNIYLTAQFNSLIKVIYITFVYLFSQTTRTTFNTQIKNK